MNKSKTLTLYLLFIFLVNCEESASASEIFQSAYPSEFDWRSEDILTPPKDQGNFGTCWAFATVGIVEASIKKNLGEIVDLSEQHLVNCNSEIGPATGLSFAKNFGILTENKLPYSGAKDTSFSSNTPGDYKVNYAEVVDLSKLDNHNRIEHIKKSILKYGPVLTHVTLTRDLTIYEGGIFIYDGNSEILGGHIAVITGWKNDPDVKNGGYWICKNSSGSSWGEAGYFRIAYDEGEIALYYIGIVNEPVKIAGN